MGYLLFALFVGIPLIEIAVFISVGGQIGVWPTIALVILTAIAGSALLRWQGFSTLMRARQSLDQGIVPMKEVFDGVCLLAAGALLLTPGFVTDALGLLLFVPAFRHGLGRALWRHLAARGVIHVHTQGGGFDGGPGDGPSDGPGGVTIDGDYEEVDPDEPEKKKLERAITPVVFRPST